jgi:hypothetical protein
LSQRAVDWQSQSWQFFKSARFGQKAHLQEVVGLNPGWMWVMLASYIQLKRKKNSQRGTPKKKHFKKSFLTVDIFEKLLRWYQDISWDLEVLVSININWQVSWFCMFLDLDFSKYQEFWHVQTEKVLILLRFLVKYQDILININYLNFLFSTFSTLISTKASLNF